MVEAVEEAVGWFETYLCRPHEGVGRPGAVCPFMVPALRADGVRVQAFPGGAGLDGLLSMVDAMVEVLRGGGWPTFNRALHAVVAALPDLPHADTVSSATLTATLPPGATATNLSAGCTTTPGTVTCAYGPIANGTAVNRTFRVPLSLLSLGPVQVTATRTASSPTDPNTADDTGSATCTVLFILLATCP
ncbi:DUF6875 domain-containing protein [Streptomyces sp. NPDC102283]|uniref:DUF6875 domain-containing protein n=1 Tax=Streptomyces sp. NPDC102283 TaxID=3366155 RepID=UPI00380382BA